MLNPEYTVEYAFHEDRQALTEPMPYPFAYEVMVEISAEVPLWALKLVEVCDE